jgi:hypothetical protein
MRTLFHPHADGTFTVQRREEDVEPLLDLNKHLRSVPQKTDGLKHIASIPAIMIERWIIEDGVNVLALRGHEAAEYFRKKVRDPQYRGLLTTDKL